MPETAPDKVKSRKKASAPKVRTGCLTCRKRRIKCDETKPQCNRCTIRGLECHGYNYSSDIPLPNNAIPINVSVKGSNFIDTLPIPERQAFYTFRTNISLNDFTGPFSPDRDFWVHDILRASQISPAVWYSIQALAVTSMWERTAAKLGDKAYSTGRYDISALTHYNKAIGHLVKPMQEKSISFADQEILLIGSLLCIEISLIRKDHKQLFIHAHHALQLMFSWKNWHHNKPKILGQSELLLTKHSTLYMMRYLETAFLWNGAARQGLVEKKAAEEEEEIIPFTSPLDAYKDLSTIYMSLITLYRGDYSLKLYLPQAHRLPDARIEYCRELDQWEQRYAHLRDSDALSGSEILGHSVLQLLYFTANVALKVNPAKLEMGWDTLGKDFESIIFRTKFILNNYGRAHIDTTSEEAAAVLRYTAKVNEPLYFTGIHCRDPVIRREAIATLKDIPRTPGDVNDLHVAISEARMWAEENRLLQRDTKNCDCNCIRGTRICNNHRVVVSNVDNRMLGQARLSLWTREQYLREDSPYVTTITFSKPDGGD